MRARPALFLLICCCAGLSACTAAASKGPDVTVSTPSVGRPQPPASIEAALSRAAFTPYAALGQSNNDGLAPGESTYALAAACMGDAGYPNAAAGDVPFSVQFGPANLAFSQPWGAWGYLGAAEAEQYGFRLQPGAALSDLGIDTQASNQGDVPQAEQSATEKCGTITQQFSNAVQGAALAGVNALSNDLSDDVLTDTAVKNATQGWAACMVKNGYSFSQPQNVFRQEIQNMYGGSHLVNTAATVSAAANRAQIATAVADAGCTDSTDLAGIYFAALASYEQQIVNANQQALTTAVRQYRAAYAKELGMLPGLLKTASAQPFPSAPLPSAKPGQPSSAAG